MSKVEIKTTSQEGIIIERETETSYGETFEVISFFDDLYGGESVINFNLSLEEATKLMKTLQNLLKGEK